MTGAAKNAWLRFFRIVNLPTVPGDVFAGAAAAAAAGAGLPPGAAWRAASAAAASCFVYLFGLADNDIVGAATDADRPIPLREISMATAKRARFACLAAATAVLLAGGSAMLPAAAFAFAAAAVAAAYNRTKHPLLMGLCRGLNLAIGAAAFAPAMQGRGAFAAVASLAALWTAYGAFITKYSEGEENDPARKRRTGLLVGAIVYLQLIALAACAVVCPATNRLLVAGAAMLVLLRAAKSAFPEVSAS